jgi:hypothetical protein
MALELFKQLKTISQASKPKGDKIEMTRKLYVTTKVLQIDSHLGPHLIGILSENAGRYQFEYKLGGKLPKRYFLLDEFPDIRKVYTGTEVEKFIFGIIPERTHRFVNEFLKAANLKEYDVWGLLQYNASMSRFSPREAGLLHEQLPEGTVIYENLERG